ncbi:MAG: efflux RND transporter permease subunit, partial [Thermoanaerobaculia bacterium]
MLERLLRNRAVVLTATVALLIAGALALPQLGSGIYPEVDFPRISVVLRSGDDPPELLQASAVRDVEEAVATVPGVRRVRTRIVRGAAEIGLLFSPETDMAQALQLTNARLAEARSELPEATQIAAERLTPAEFPVLAFNLVGGGDGAEGGKLRRETAERLIRSAFARAPGVARVEVLGGDEREVEVIVTPERLASLGLTASALGDRLAGLLTRRGLGRVDELGQTSAVLLEPAEREIASLGELPVVLDAAADSGRETAAVLALSAIADVRPGAADRRILVRAPEGEAVQVAISRLPGASTPDVVAAVLHEAEGLRLPPGLRLVSVYDQGQLVGEALTGIRDAILLGLLLTMIVLALFLRDFRTGLLASLSLPATLLGTLAVMHWTRQSLNLMSLGGLAIAIGLVIDDAVVVVEAVVARRERGESNRAALAGALADVAAPVVGTTLTTVVVFVPLAFLSGIVGSFFSALAATLSGAVLLSMLFALVVLPVLAPRILGWSASAGATVTPPAAGAERRPAGGGRGGRARRRRHLVWRVRYAALLRRSLGRRWVALAAATLALVAGGLALRSVSTGFLPEFDEGTFVLDYFLPAGSSLVETDRQARQIERILTADPAVATWSRRTGAELGPITATQTNTGDITVRLTPRAGRPEAEEVIAGLRGKLATEVPAARVEFIQLIEDVLSDLSGAPRPIELRIFGDEPAELERAARDVARAVEADGGVPGLVDFYDGVEARVPTLRLRPRVAALARVGITPAALADDLATGLTGREVGTVAWLDRLIGVRLRFPDAIRFDPAALRGLPLAVGANRTVRLDALVDVRLEPEASVLYRENLRPVILASADVEGGDLGGVGREV